MSGSPSDRLTGTSARAVAERMGEAAERWLASLSADQREQAQFPFDDQAERTRWYYTPNLRNGLPFIEMDRNQRRLAHQLIATGLSRAGYVTATTIIGLEATLDAIEGWSFPEYGRDPLRYYVSVFGTPHGHEPWGWRVDGHHVCLNYTLADARVVAPTPTFFGSNPAEAPLGGVATLRPLSGVEDLARELIHLLGDEQRATAIISPLAPPDIVMGNRPFVVEGALPLPAPVLSGQPLTNELHHRAEQEWQERGLTDRALKALRYAEPKGLAASAMNHGQREVLNALIQEYIGRMPDELAEIETARLRADGIESVHLAWAGRAERHQPHYYRLQGPRFLVEYDNTQDDANHIHSVWRDPSNDFGADLLARHYADAHGHAGKAH